MQVAHSVVRMFHLAVCQALPLGDMNSVITDQLMYASTLDLQAVKSYVDCLNMDTSIKFWSVVRMNE